MHLLVWALSTIIPLAYLGHKSNESLAQVSSSKIILSDYLACI